MLKVEPAAHGQKHFIMEKQKLLQQGGELFICTECGDGFNQYTSLLAHMSIHGPLESFSFDGSSNGLEVPREYVLQENGTLTVVNGSVPTQSFLKPVSPGVFPSHFTSVKPKSPPPGSQPPLSRDLFRPKPTDLSLDKSRQGHYRCEVCNRSFNNLQSLHRHQQYRNTEWGYKCTLCCKIFEKIQDFKKHLSEHANDKFHCCLHCGKRFLKVHALNAHQKENHFSPKVSAPGRADPKLEKEVEKTFPCKKCKLNFFWMSDLQIHSEYHCRGKEPVTVPKVKIEVKSQITEDTTLENSSNDHRSVDEKDSQNTDIAASGGSSGTCTPYRCGLCGDHFITLKLLMEHHLTHQTQEEIDKLNEESQMASKHRVAPKGRRRRGSNPAGKLHPCKHCHRVFNHSSSLSRHMRYHKGTMHACVFCGRHFPQRCDLRRHVTMYHKTELDRKPNLKLLFTTPHRFPQAVIYSGDKNTNPSIEEKKSPSDELMASFEEKQAGKAGRVNYKCHECGKTFGLLCVYQRHLRYHKKEPSKGPAQFKISSSLERHIQNQPSTREEGVDGHSGDAAVTKGNAEDIEDDDDVNNSRNSKGNSSEVLYECSECTETFSCLEMFLQHQTSHGSENTG